MLRPSAHSGALTVQSADLGTISEDLNTQPSYEPGCNVLQNHGHDVNGKE